MRYYLVFGQLQRALGVSWEEIGNSWWIAISRASDLRDDSESRECVVCMEEDIPLADLCVLPCAHAMSRRALALTVISQQLLINKDRYANCLAPPPVLLASCFWARGQQRANELEKVSVAPTSS